MRIKRSIGIWGAISTVILAGAHGAHTAGVYDYIVVGAGACGAVVASRLAERGKDVLILETGEDEHDNPLSRWGFFFPSTFYSHLYRNFFTEPEVNVSNRRLYHMSTKALGGGTAVNAMVWTWGDRRDWELIDIEGWKWEDVQPYFIKSENYTGDDKQGRRGHEGPMVLGSFPPNNATRAAVETAAAVLGVPVAEDNNGGEHESSAIVQRNFKGATINTGERWDTWTAYLKPAMRRFSEKLEVVTRATVLRVLVSADEDGVPPRATGVYFLRDGMPYKAMARQEVILSAGAYGTPKLLMLSGIGDCSELEPLGIDCVVHSSGVGKKLVDHINPGSILYIGPPRDDYDANIVAAYTRTGVVEDELTPDVELGFIMGPPTEDPSAWDKVPALYTFYSLWLLHDGVGRITLKSKDPLEDPVLVSGFLKTEDDEKRLVKLFRMLSAWAERFQEETGLQLEQASRGGNAIPVNRNSTDEEILTAAKGVLSTHWHVAQSCRMGDAGDTSAVVDPQFRVHGVNGLRVVDASSQPVLTNGHPMAVLVMMAERAVDFMLADESEQSAG